MRIAIIGCGNMGTRLAQRLSNKDNVLFLYDRDIAWTQELSQKIGGNACFHPTEAVQQTEMTILATKPQDLKQVANQIDSTLQSNQLVISLLAGISVKTLKSYFPAPFILRMMPNLALLYGEGVIGLSKQDYLHIDLQNQLEDVFASLGKVYWLPEAKIDALTSLTGSGPAFLFVLIEAMIDAGIAMGFNAKDAKTLVLQMIKGSLTILQETDQHPGELKWQITSPAGTTIEGLRKLEEEGLRGKLMNTFLAAYERAQTLGTSENRCN